MSNQQIIERAAGIAATFVLFRGAVQGERPGEQAGEHDRDRDGAGRPEVAARVARALGSRPAQPRQFWCDHTKK